MSLPGMSLGGMFCLRRKGGTGEGGWVQPKSKKAWKCLGLDVEGLGWHWASHFSPPLYKWAEDAVLSSCRASISGSEALFSLYRQSRLRAMAIESL